MCSRRRAATARPLGPAPMISTSWIVGRVVVVVGVGGVGFGWSMVGIDRLSEAALLLVFFWFYCESVVIKTMESDRDRYVLVKLMCV